MEAMRHAAAIGAVVALLVSPVRAQHALDKLLDPSAPKAQRQGQVESSVIDSSHSADGELKSKVDNIDRNLSSIRRSQESSSAASKAATSVDRQATPGRSQQARANVASPVLYTCKIYCKSASGPSVERDFRAGSRREAAQLAGDGADAICQRAGHVMASARALPESQCWTK